MTQWIAKLTLTVLGARVVACRQTLFWFLRLTQRNIEDARERRLLQRSTDSQFQLNRAKWNYAPCSEAHGNSLARKSNPRPGILIIKPPIISWWSLLSAVTYRCLPSKNETSKCMSDTTYIYIQALSSSVTLQCIIDIEWNTEILRNTTSAAWDFEGGYSKIPRYFHKASHTEQVLLNESNSIHHWYSHFCNKAKKKKKTPADLLDYRTKCAAVMVCGFCVPNSNSIDVNITFHCFEFFFFEVYK